MRERNEERGPRAEIARRVLILDDNQDYAANLGEILESWGARVRVAHDLAAADRLLLEVRPEIAFVDLRLPDGSGQDFVNRLRQTCPDCLSIVLTGNASIQAAADSVNAGAFGFLLKNMPVKGIQASFRRAEERLELERQTRELEGRLRHQEQLALIGQMAATLAHEIKNPLTGIAQAIEALLDSVGREPEGMEGVRKSILNRFRNLNDLVEELLEFSKPLTVRAATIEVKVLVEDVIRDLTVEGRLDGIEPTIQIDPDAETIHVDSHHFHLVLRNLFLNAVQAMEKSEQRAIRVRSRRIGDEVVLEVEDTGSGVSEENVKKIFEPFFTTRTRGTGLGLALVSRIIEEHGGSVSVRRVAPHGVCFAIVIRSFEPDGGRRIEIAGV